MPGTLTLLRTHESMKSTGLPVRDWPTRLKQRFSVQAAATAFMALVGLMLAGGFVYDAWSSRLQTIARATESATNLVRSVAQHADDTVRGADAALIGLVERIEIDGVEGEARERLRRVFQRHISTLPPLKGLSFINAEGDSIVNSQAFTQRINFADRDYFQFHRAHSAPFAYIGKPVRSRVTGDWIIPLSRRVNHADGSFAGLMLATLDMTYFQKFYDGFSIGEKGVITLVSGNAQVLARRPFVEANVGRDLSGGAIFKDYLPQSPEGAV